MLLLSFKPEILQCSRRLCTCGRLVDKGLYLFKRKVQEKVVAGLQKWTKNVFQQGYEKMRSRYAAYNRVEDVVLVRETYERTTRTGQ